MAVSRWPVPAGGFGLEATVAAPSAKRRRVAIKWLSFWVGSLVAGCVTPYGYDYLLQTFHVLDLGDVLRRINELRPMNPYTDRTQEVILLCLMLNYFEATREMRERLPTGFQLEQNGSASPAGDKLDQLVDKYKVSWTLPRPQSAAALHFDRSLSWRRIYADSVAVVHVRN
jgi:hypothetical protein